MPAIFSSDGRSFGFLKTEASVRMGLKAVFMLKCFAVCVLHCPIPLNIGYHGKASRDRMVALWARPWLGSIFNEFSEISIDL